MAKGDRQSDNKAEKVREMRNAETVLEIIRIRGMKRLPLEDVYRQLFNPELYLRAYGRIYRNEGAMTKGITHETVDGMSLAKIEKIINDLRHERYRWTSVRRTLIPKKNGKLRPLGIPTWSDKLLQEVIRSILEAYYEPQFSDCSHGFRPNRGCHTALEEIEGVWHGTKWFIEGDIKGCFDNIDHKTLLTILRENIRDNRFLRLMENLLKAGYCEQWNYYPTFSGTPQGGIVSPILSNIYLDRLDKYVEEDLIPEFTQGKRRKGYREARRLDSQKRRDQAKGKREEVKELQKQLRTIPCADPYDPNYRRLRYMRYADDWILGFAGPKGEAEEIKARIKRFLRDALKLELSQEKTLITNASSERARFLGYEILCQYSDTKIANNRRSVNGHISLRVPLKFIQEKVQLYMRKGKPVHRAEFLPDDDFTIIHRYQSEYRGFVNYYQLAQNIASLNYLRYIMETSLLKTLACKHKSTVKKMVNKYRSTVDTLHGKRKCLKAVVERPQKSPLTAVFGGIPLRRTPKAVIEDKPLSVKVPRAELIKRLLAEECELCGTKQNIEVHHVRKLSDLKVRGRAEKPAWVKLMSARKRKTLVLCRRCHDAVHAGKPAECI